MFMILDTLAYQNGLAHDWGWWERYIEHSRGGWTHKEEIDNRNETLIFIFIFIFATSSKLRVLGDLLSCATGCLEGEGMCFT